MRKKLLGNCPVCNERLFVTEMTCKDCKTQIKGEFTLSKFDESEPQTRLFIYEQGSVSIFYQKL